MRKHHKLIVAGVACALLAMSALAAFSGPDQDAFKAKGFTFWIEHASDQGVVIDGMVGLSETLWNAQSNGQAIRVLPYALRASQDGKALWGIQELTRVKADGSQPVESRSSTDGIRVDFTIKPLAGRTWGEVSSKDDLQVTWGSAVAP
jgi:hypothetical protein